MQGKRGFSLIELLIVIGIMLIIASILIPNLVEISQRAHFEKHIGLKPSDSWKKDPDAMAIVQGLVTHRLAELKLQTDVACEEAGLLDKQKVIDTNYSVPTTPEAARQQLQKLTEHRILTNSAINKCNQLGENYREAVAAAKSFGFKIPETD